MEWRFYNINGPHHILTLFYVIKIMSFPLGVLCLLALDYKNLKAMRVLYFFKLLEMLILPLLGVGSAKDMCRSYLYF